MDGPRFTARNQQTLPRELSAGLGGSRGRLASRSVSVWLWHLHFAAQIRYQLKK